MERRNGVHCSSKKEERKTMIVLDRALFTTNFSVACAAVPSKTSKDVLKSVMLTTDGELLTRSASDGEVHLKSTLPHQGEKIKVLLPAARVLAILRELDGETLKLTVKPNKLRIQCGSADFDIGISDAADYPEVPTFDADSYWEIEPQAFREAIRRTVFCVDMDSARYALAGIQFELGEKMTLASTDSRRLSVQTLAAKAVNNPPVPNLAACPVVPAKAVKLVEKSLEIGTPVQVSCRSNDASFRNGNISITTQLLQGRFPDWRKVIPKKFINKILIPVNPFAQLLRQAGVMESEESRATDLTFDKGTLKAQSASTEIGQAKSEIPIPNDQEPMTISLDGRYVREYLKCLDAGESVEVCLVAPDDRVLFRVGEFLHVIMPLSKD
jgi:DNA polymerase-3 subunit beta